MANYSGWRAISRRLIYSRKWKRIDNEARVMWLMLMLAADSYGAIEASPDFVLDQCMPNVPGWTEAKVAKALDTLADAELLDRWEHDGVLWLQLRDFDEHQQGDFMRKRGRRRSPEPPQEKPLHTADGPANSAVSPPSTTATTATTARTTASAVNTVSADQVELQLQTAAVYEHWRSLEETTPSVDGTPGIRGPKLTPGRSERIRARLAEGYTVAELCESISGHLADPWHLGDNNRKTRYTDLPTLLKNASKVDAGRVKFAQQQSASAAKRNGTSRVRPQAVGSV